jgi:DNA-binding CsgD family transcriptional regulator
MRDIRMLGIKPLESQVLSLLVRGHSVPHIAGELHISPGYVYFLMRELRLRFLVGSTVALVGRAIAEGIIRPDGTFPNTSMCGPQTDGITEYATEIIPVVSRSRRTKKNL